MARPLTRIGVNLLYLVPERVGGTEIYATRLLEALATVRPGVAFSVFGGKEAQASFVDRDWPDGIRFVPVPVRSANKPLRIAAELAILPLYLARADVQVLHSFGTTTPFATRAARVVTIHDLIYEHSRGAFPTAARLGLKAVVPFGARRAHRVIVPSEATKADVVARLRVAPSKVDVIYSGPGMPRIERPTAEDKLRADWRLGDAPVLLSVSAALPHKNLERLLRAFARVADPSPAPASDSPTAVKDVRADPAAGPGPVLVLAGHAGRAQAELTRLAAQLGIDDRVRLTGWLSDADLEGFYGLATCFAYPSLYEGFGLPVLEAMLRGVPVACSNATSLPEIAGDAAELFDPLDLDAMTAALRALLTDAERRADLSARGRSRAAGFTWTKTAEGVFESYEGAWRAATEDSSAVAARQ